MEVQKNLYNKVINCEMTKNKMHDYIVKHITPFKKVCDRCGFTSFVNNGDNRVQKMV